MIIEVLWLISFIFVIISFGVVLFNYFTAPKMGNITVALKTTPLISVLIPARNEERSIERTIQSIINQSYKNIEIIVLNDFSTDNTKNIVQKLMKQNNNIKLIDSSPLPEGWLGKNWACNQLANTANGEYLLFIDADVYLGNNAISYSIETMEKYKLNMLSCFPTQIENTFGEKLIVPLMNWLLLSFLPLKKVYSSKNKLFVAANGQYIMFEKNTYSKLGTHAAVNNKVVEDMEFARLVKRNKMNMMTLLGNNQVNCNMYSGFSSSILGFTKNYYAGFNTSTFNFILLQVFLFIVFVLPFGLVFSNYLFLYNVIIILLIRVVLTTLTKENYLINVFLHPLQLLLMGFIGLKSVVSFNKKRILWKGRTI